MSEPVGPSLVRGPRSGRYLVAFELPAADGRRVRLWDYRQRRNLAIFFHHGVGCPRCRAELTRFARAYPAFRERDAEVLAIGPDEPVVQAALAADLGLPFPLLSDPDGSVLARQRMLADADAGALGPPAIVVTDRIEQVWAAWAPLDELKLPSQEEILGWLEFAVLQCHNGCSPPDWELARGD